jgi:hypothetical protein
MYNWVTLLMWTHMNMAFGDYDFWDVHMLPTCKGKFKHIVTQFLTHNWLSKQGSMFHR